MSHKGSLSRPGTEVITITLINQLDSCTLCFARERSCFLTPPVIDRVVISPRGFTRIGGGFCPLALSFDNRKWRGKKSRSMQNNAGSWLLLTEQAMSADYVDNVVTTGPWSGRSARISPSHALRHILRCRYCNWQYSRSMKLSHSYHRKLEWAAGHYSLSCDQCIYQPSIISLYINEWTFCFQYPWLDLNWTRR